MALLFPAGYDFDSAAGRLFIFENNTTTPATVYTDELLTTAHDHPIVLDSGGQCGNIYVSDGVSYTVQVTDSSAAELWSRNDIWGSIKDIENATFTTSVTGGVARSRQEKISEVVSVLDFGTTGDGVTNDTPAIQATIDAVAAKGGGVVFFPEGVYSIEGVASSPILTLADNVELRGERGAKIRANQHSLPDHRAATEGLIVAAGSVGSAVTVSSDVAKGAITIAVSSVTGLAEEDWILLSDDVQVDSINNAELLQIRSISGTTLTLSSAVLEASYTTAQNAQIQKATLVKNVVIDGLELEGVGDSTATATERGDLGFDLSLCENPIVKNCYVHDCNNTAIIISSSVAPKVQNNHIQCQGDSSVEGLQYGIKINSACRDAIVSNNSLYGCKHGVSLGATTASFRGAPRRTLVIGNTVIGSWDHAIMCHKADQYYTFTGNHISGCYGGLEMRGKYGVGTNNTIIGAQEDAIFLRNFAQDMLVSGNYIEGVYLTGNNGILLSTLESGHVPARIVISNNVIHNVLNRGINLVDLDSTTLREGFVITGNSVNSCGDDGIRLVGAFSGLVNNNFIDDSTGLGIELIGTRYLQVSGNSIHNSGAYGIQLDDNTSPAITADYNIIRDNVIRGYSAGDVDASGAGGANNVDSNDDLGSAAPS